VRYVLGFVPGCYFVPAEGETRLEKMRKDTQHIKKGEGFALWVRKKICFTSDLPRLSFKPSMPQIVFFRSFLKCTVASDTATAVSRSHFIRIFSTTLALSALLFAFSALNFRVMFLQSFSALALRMYIALLAFRITL
jgi:hypothetical protein